ncbi:hypothetical protein DFH06DRAFT_1332661 [Mycena polygramma]|nr:hypothetical protein DFH06DRAFT_1332661 [Mycena polygramma]
MEQLPGSENNPQLHMPDDNWAAQNLPQGLPSYGGQEDQSNYYSQNANRYTGHYPPNGGGGPTYDQSNLNYRQAEPVPHFPSQGLANQLTEQENEQWPSMAEQVAAEVAAQVALQVKAQVDRQMEEFWEKIHEREKLKAQQDEEDRAARQPKGRAKVDSPEIYAKVTEVMLALLGMSDAQSEIPGPMMSGEAARVDENGVKLHNPTWEGRPGAGQALVGATTKTVMSNERACRTFDEKLGPLDAAMEARVRRAAVQHWTTKRNNYRAQNTIEGAKRKAKKTRYNRDHHRTKSLVTVRRKFVPVFREKYGPANTEGVDAILFTPWASEDGSQCGEADKAVWDQRRKNTGDKTATERIDLEWRGVKPKRVNAILDTLARKHAEDEAKKKQAQGGSDRRRGRTRKTDRFPGFPENRSKRGPGDRIPFRSCVDPAWLAATACDCLEDPAEFTIFDLIIPEADFDDEAKAMLAN